MAQAKKNFVIQAFRQSPQMDTTHAQKSCDAIERGINEIYLQNSSQLSFEEHYRCGYNLVLHKHGDMLYNAVRKVLLRHLQKSAAVISSQNTNENLLTTLNEEWKRHKLAFQMVGDILMYMDRSYCTPRQLPSTRQLAYTLFREEIVYHSNIRERFRGVILDQIQLERKGYIIDRNLLQDCLRMLVTLSTSTVFPYEEEFEKCFLQETAKFYQQETLQYLVTYSCIDYLLKIHIHYQDETSRLMHYLAPNTESKLMQILDQECIITHAKTLLDMEHSGFTFMIWNGKFDQLSQLYTLFQRIPHCIDLLSDYFYHYIRVQGHQILSSNNTNEGIGTMTMTMSSGGGSGGKKDAIAVISGLLQFKDFLDMLLSIAFKHDKKFVKKMKDAYEYLLNADAALPPPPPSINASTAASATSTTTHSIFPPPPPTFTTTSTTTAPPSNTNTNTNSPPTSSSTSHQSIAYLAQYIDELLKQNITSIPALSFTTPTMMMNTTTTSSSSSSTASANATSSSSASSSSTAFVTEEEIEKQLDKVMILFKFIHDKDIFEYHYKQALAKRLLSATSSSSSSSSSSMSGGGGGSSNNTAGGGKPTATTMSSTMSSTNTATAMTTMTMSSSNTGSTGGGGSSSTGGGGGGGYNDELEKSFLSKLKTECGYQYTSKLEGMLVDMKSSKILNSEYQQSSLYPTCGYEMEITLLTIGYWPSSVTNTLPIPMHIPVVFAEQGCATFAHYYNTKYSGRKLTWMTSLGSVDLRAIFPLGKKELNVTFYQACILLLFNSQSTLSFPYIKQCLELPDYEVGRHLLSLCTPKLKLVTKASKGKGLEFNDTFTCNLEFTSKFKRMKAPLIANKDIFQTTDEQGNIVSSVGSGGGGGVGGGEGSAAIGGSSNVGEGGIPANVEEDRRHIVEATIVRIMKTRKTLNHHDLIAEVTKQLSMRFIPSPQFIKKRIESLIEREYLQRHPDDARCYNYLA